MRYLISKADAEFKHQFEACEIAAGGFNHEAHIRLAYIYLAENDTESSITLMRASLKRFLQHNNVDPMKYHETLTRAWILAVHHFMNKTGHCSSTGEFIARHPEMLDTNIMMSHYSADVLFTDAAREAFVEPNLDPIPEYEN